MPKLNPTETEWRIIGVSGETADGRQISEHELKEMAEQYDPAVYTARLNLEHIRFVWAQYDGGYGDVLALKAEPWPQDTSKTALYAKFSVLPALQELWDKGQKLFTSMEIVSRFADTGKAYLTGLAITDSPASLGTTANYSMAAPAAAEKHTVFTAYRQLDHQEKEPAMPQNTTAAQPEASPSQQEQIAEGIFSRLLAKFGISKEPNHEPPAADVEPEQPAEPKPQIDYAAEYQAAAELVEKLTGKVDELEQKLADQATAHAELLAKLEQEPASGQRQEHGGDIPAVGW